MSNTYRLVAAGTCPKGGRDQYEITISSDGIIEVEVIIGIVEAAIADPRFQEDITRRIAEGLDEHFDALSNQDGMMPNGSWAPTGEVKVTGVHSGVVVDSEEKFG